MCQKKVWLFIQNFFILHDCFIEKGRNLQINNGTNGQEVSLKSCHHHQLGMMSGKRCFLKVWIASQSTRGAREENN